MKAIHLYVAAATAAATAALMRVDPHPLTDAPGVAVTVAVVAAVSAAWPIRVPNSKIHFTVSHPVILGGLALLGGPGCIMASVACVVGATAGKLRRTSRMRLVFNVAAQVLSAALAAEVFRLLGGAPGRSMSVLLVPLVASTAALFVSNSCLISGAIAIEQRAPFAATWRDGFAWSAVTYFSGLSVTAAALMFYEVLGGFGVLLAVPPVWMLAEFFRAHRGWQAEQLRRVAEVETLNEALERKVADRTEALERALEDIEDANTRLVRTNAQLTEASRTKSEFLANVSHELRTPLNSVIGFSELLAESRVDRLTDKHRKFLRAIHESGRSLLDTINDLLDLSKIEAGRMAVDRKPTDVARIVEDVATIVRPQAERNGLALRVSLESCDALADVDPRHLQEVVLNLLSNAVKFTPENGTVEVEASYEADTLVVVVVDDGIGIASEDHDKVFQQFRQADASYTRKFKGTGLGLALVRSRLELHGGSVELRSALGEGARFTCRFPDVRLEGRASESEGSEVRIGDPSPAGSTDVDSGSAACRSETPGASGAGEVPRATQAPPVDPSEAVVLVADSAALDRRMASSALKAAGYAVIEATRVEEAIERAARSRPDVVLVADALERAAELVEAVRNDPGSAATPVIGLRAPGAGATRIPGLTGEIAKPIDLARFAEEVSGHVSGKENAA